MAENPILDSLLQKLLATDDPVEKAAIVAETAFEKLPGTVALVARRCVILHWFDETIVTVLLDFIPSTERLTFGQTAFATLAALPFVEKLAWGLAYHDQTRTGLLARTSPEILQRAAALAMPAYLAHENGALARAEALYCALAIGQPKMVTQVLDSLLENAVRREDWQTILVFFQTLEQASELPFAVLMPLTALYLFIRGLARHELGDLAGAIKDYDQVVALDPDNTFAYSMWGNALSDQAVTKSGEEADRLFSLAGEKYQAALQIKPDKHEALNNWGSALSNQAVTKSGEEADRLFSLAGEKLIKVESLLPGSGAYNLACWNALRGEESQCQRWLEKSKKLGLLPSREHLMNDPDLESVRKCEWFTTFLSN